MSSYEKQARDKEVEIGMTPMPFKHVKDWTEDDWKDYLDWLCE